MLEIWYDKPGEADPTSSWIGLSKTLSGCPTSFLDLCPYSKVLALAEYARPDLILTYNGNPYLVMELTVMNPSGHNLPQRFSCLVRAAELGIPSIYYYPEYARRSNSDPNPRYLNIRVPLSQVRLSDIYHVPSLSLFWPTDDKTLKPMSGLKAHQKLADTVDYITDLAIKGEKFLFEDKTAQAIIAEMNVVVQKYYSEGSYPKNESYRNALGDLSTPPERIIGLPIDPPGSCELLQTDDLLKDVFTSIKNVSVPSNKKISQLKAKKYSFVYTGTANSSKDGPEHPYPGYLTMLDILYARIDGGQTPRDRIYNLVFKLPITLGKFKDKALDRPTGLNILMEFADLIILDDAVVVGGYLRNLSAGAVLVSK